jgi:hypothetical protein
VVPDQLLSVAAFEESLTVGALYARVTLIAAADEHATKLMPVLRAIREAGAKGFGAIASALNERNIPTPRGARWHVSSLPIFLAHAEARSNSLEQLQRSLS